MEENTKPPKNEAVKEVLRQRKKQSKQVLKEKRARLMVKNLPFKATEENLKEHFEKYGEIKSVKLLRKPDGKLVGCGFVQFAFVQKAAKAKHYTNHQPFLGRNILVDFALSKDKFKKQKLKKEKEVKTEIKQEDVEIKEAEEIKEKIDIDEDTKPLDLDSENESNSEDENLDDDDDIKEENDDVEEIKPKVISNDVNEGKTVFIKNVPFAATNEDVKLCMSQYGPIYYALVVMDKITEHSKGTAFVKFRNKEDAEKALQAGTELTLMGNTLDCHPALQRGEVEQKLTDKKEKKSEPKDSRNLYLVKEGVILAGTKAAQGVSASDMAKRLQLEQYKTQMLRNLNMFVSKERIVIHNLPATWDDKKLKILVEKYAGQGAVFREVRTMRDMKNVDAKGVGASKEFGFVTFTKHEHALNVLRALNNNPNIFSPTKRPIVAFSIENRVMVNARQKRMEKSRQKNPKHKDYNPELNKIEDESKKRKFEVEENLQEFSGVPAKPGPQKMRSRYKLSTQAKLHHENLKKEKKKKKFAKKSLSEKKQEFTKQPRQKINQKKGNDRDDFSKLVSDYKNRLTSGPFPTKAKWYE
ncbi:unnamed protein product [Brassicogethes aeneus]|uniref:RRM domain-containing protein n=1 Tax=Brassicogethes aeneus TaxID=1431903 RepID=A0A9P0FK15_BRAAE|nr:unnamed protein product [Brassicogethes aeneus]